VAERSGDRSAHFPAIEKKHGKPMRHWFALLGTLEGRPYAVQMALLQEGHGFSRAHANATVMHFRGSTSSRRHDSLDDFLSAVEARKAATVRAILAAATSAEKGLEVVIAWNQPMVRRGKDYVFGVSVAKNHVLIAPWGNVLDEFRPRLTEFTVNKKTVQVPPDWKVDKVLVRAMVRARIAELG
jgi:uncharacterized protein YdhG (YjbR/CyaY superfamily)